MAPASSLFLYMPGHVQMATNTIFLLLRELADTRSENPSRITVAVSSAFSDFCLVGCRLIQLEPLRKVWSWESVRLSARPLKKSYLDELVHEMRIFGQNRRFRCTCANQLVRLRRLDAAAGANAPRNSCLTSGCRQKTRPDKAGSKITARVLGQIVSDTSSLGRSFLTVDVTHAIDEAR